jgi:ribonuclease Z
LLDTRSWRVSATPLEHGGIVSLAYALEEPLHVAIHKDALEREGMQPGPWLMRFKDLVRAGVQGDRPLEVLLAGGGSRTETMGRLRERIAHVERGMKVVYVTDAAPSSANADRIVALAENAHLLVIEATFAAADYARAVERNHLTAELAGELARRAGAARLLVFHHSPRYQDDPERLPREAAAAFGGRSGRSPGQVLGQGAQGGGAQTEEQGP